MMRGVIFDMDGVLVDSHPVHMRAWRRLFESMGRPATEKEMEFILEGRKREEILRYYLGDLSEEQLRAFGRQKESLFQEESKTISTIPGVQKFLAELAEENLPMAVASCGGSERVNHLLDILGLRRYFPIVVTGDDVKEGKPDPTIFRETAARMRLYKEELLVVEDSVSGVQAAKGAGMKCLGIAAPERAGALQKAGADQIVADFFAASPEKVRIMFSSEETQELSGTNRRG